MLNATLQAAVDQVIGARLPAQFRIKARFFSSNPASSFSFAPQFIEGLLKHSDYLAKYGDEFDIALMVSPKDYALLQDQGQNLRCALTLSYITREGRDVFSPAPVSKQYYAMINDPQDVRMAVTDIHKHVTPSVPITLRLVDQLFYKLRHTRINKVYQRATVEEAIYGAASDLGIERIHLVKPDNTHRYDHIEITSYQGVDTLMWYLHSKCGVYTHGCNSYVSNGVLYVYPPFQTAPVYDKRLIFYQVERGRFEGVPTYHRNEGKSVSIVVNTEPKSVDLSIQGAENHGTGFVFTRSSRLTDGFTSVNNGAAKFTEQPSLSVSLTNPRTVDNGSHNNFHVKATDNPFTPMSRLMSHQASLMEVQWPHGDMFAIDPGHAVTFHYDRNGVMMKRTGIVEMATFEALPTSDSDKKDKWTANGTLGIRLSPNETRVI